MANNGYDPNQPRDELGRWTDSKGFYRANTPYAEILKADREKEQNISGAISGALDPESEEASEHAKRFYEAMRHRKDDISSIAKNTGFAEGDISKVKNYLFVDEHLLEDGIHTFVPDADIAESWQRLMDGRIRPVDILLIKHELLEMEYVKRGMTQMAAHKKTDETYNYALEIKQICKENRKNGMYKKHKKGR